MEMCRTNIEMMWLMCQLTPDFRTISDFRKDNKGAIKKVFKAFVKMCAELGLYNTEVGVQDGSKFSAMNSKDNNVTVSKLEKKLQMAEEEIEKYLDELDKNDNEESDLREYTKEEIEKMLERLRERKEKYLDYLNEMNEAGVTQISFTDPESRLMKTSDGGFDVCFNIQIVVDPESHMIGAFEVTNECNDMGQLSPVTAGFKEDLGIDVIDAVADKGYLDKADMLECIMNGTIPHVPSKSGEAFHEFELDYKEATITEELLASTEPEDIRVCLEAGVVPDVYEDKGIAVSVHEVEEVISSDGETPNSSFTLNEAGTAVVCPNGSELGKVATLHGKGKTRFTSRSACRDCEDKCTASAFKQVDLKDGQTVLHIKKTRTVKKVKIRFTPDKGKIKIRKCVVEHPFGTIKQWCDGSYTLLTGMEKVAADMALLFLQYNIKRAINMVGTQELIRKMRELAGCTIVVFSRFFQNLKKLCSRSISSWACA
jgi:transposase